MYLTRRADIVESLVDLVAQKLVDIPKNEERIREIVEKTNTDKLNKIVAERCVDLITTGNVQAEGIQALVRIHDEVSKNLT